MIDDVALFLAHAVRLEADAAETYERLALQMEERANVAVAALFRQFAGYCRQHLAEARARATRETGGVLELSPDEYRWPDGHSPESPMPGDIQHLTVQDALKTALETECSACDFYSAVAGQTHSEAVQELAQEFAEEEAGHVEALKRWLERLGSP
ncbi:MAG: ferritin-like domain-containing protein [Gammaproteobacteria bacterium]